MEAKDTIIPDEELIETAESLYNFMGTMNIEGIKSVLWQQASFQAKVAFKAGIKEVVEWLISHKRGYYAHPDGTLISVISAEWTQEEWQALITDGDKR